LFLASIVCEMAVCVVKTIVVTFALSGVSSFVVYIHLTSRPICTSSLLVLHYKITTGKIRFIHRNVRDITGYRIGEVSTGCTNS
jgi:hypothetical protein